MRAVILAHFDLHGRIDDYVVSALREYRKVADLLVLVSAGATSVVRALGEVAGDHHAGEDRRVQALDRRL